MREETEPSSGKKFLVVKGRRAWQKLGIWGPLARLVFRLEAPTPSNLYQEILLGDCDIFSPYHTGPFYGELIPPGHDKIWSMPTCTGNLEQELISWRGNSVYVYSTFDEESQTLTIGVMGYRGNPVHLQEPLVFTIRWSNLTGFSIEEIAKLEDNTYKVTGLMERKDHGRRELTGTGATIQEAIDNCR